MQSARSRAAIWAARAMTRSFSDSVFVFRRASYLSTVSRGCCGLRPRLSILYVLGRDMVTLSVFIDAGRCRHGLISKRSRSRGRRSLQVRRG